MSHHELITTGQDLPDGFDTYSLLLIPDWRWIQNAGERSYFQLFKSFKLFGDSIGPKHLAAWLYNLHWGNYEKLVDLEAYSVIYGEIRSWAEARRLAVGAGSRQEGHSNPGGYDVVRAKYFCASYGLDFNDGPYIAFFDHKPVMPTVFYGFRHPTPSVSAATPTKPSFLIHFGSLSFENVLTLLNGIEYQLMRGRLNVRRLEVEQVGLELESACKTAGAGIGKAIRFLKDVKDVVPAPALQNILKDQ